MKSLSQTLYFRLRDGVYSDILVYTCVNIDFRNTTKTSYSFLQHPLKKDFVCFTSKLTPELAFFFKTPLFSWKSPFSDPKDETRVVRSTAKKDPFSCVFVLACVYQYIRVVPHDFRSKQWFTSLCKRWFFCLQAWPVTSAQVILVSFHKSSLLFSAYYLCIILFSFDKSSLSFRAYWPGYFDAMMRNYPIVYSEIVWKW